MSTSFRRWTGVYEPKWDGFRCIAFRAGGEVNLRSRHDRPLAPYFAELVAGLRELGCEWFVLDGEIVVPGPSGLRFDDLLARVHPAASRVERLSRETPAVFVAEGVRLRSGEIRRQCVVEDLRSLLWAVNLGSIELHAFPSRADKLEEPAFVVFDLDPGPGTGLRECCRIAWSLRGMLTAKGLRGFCKTSGGLGLHVYVRRASDHSFEQSKAFARSVAAELAPAHGDLVTDRRELAARTGRVLVDWIPNGPRALTVVPYSMRAGDLPSVSTPVPWEEVEAAARDDRADGMRFTPAQVLARTGAAGDLFRPVLELEQTRPSFRALRLG